MPQKHAAVTAQGGNSLFDAGAAAVVYANERCAHLHRHILNPAYFKGMIFPQRPADYRKILAGYEYQPSVDFTVSRNDAVARHTPFIQIKIVNSGFHKPVHFDKSILIEKHFYPLSRCHLSARMLFFHSGFPASRKRLFPPLFQSLNCLIPVHHETS